jgi:hypothetical protein
MERTTMLTGPSYAFIIGAGGGCPYDFPTGEELYNHICMSYSNHAGGEVQQDAKYFSKQLRLAQGVSIDKYLNVNKEFKEIGTHSIATAIHHYEFQSQLKLSGHSVVEGNWYTYLYQKMIEGFNTKEELLRIHANNVSFITFNYDRSLEHFLFSNLYGLLKNAGVDMERVANTLKKIPFIHVYGKIGDLPWQRDIFLTDRYFNANANPPILSYGADARVPGELAKYTSRMIDLIYEERKNKQEIQAAKELIFNADRVFFLGFGYDEMNLSILGLPGLLKGKTVFGTAYKSTEKEREQIERKLRSAEWQKDFGIIDCNCLMLLRNHLI